MTSSFFTQIGNDINGEAADDNSGFSLHLSADGSIVAIGSPWNDGNGLNSGHIRIYKNVNNTWTQLGNDINGEAADDEFGYSVNISDDGNVVAVGAHQNSTGNGYVRIYKNVNNTWTKVGSDIKGEGYLWPVNAESGVTPKRMARVINTVKENKIPAVFCESTVSNESQLIVADETGAKFGGDLYVDSLSQEDGPASTYLNMLNHNLKLIKDGLNDNS